MSMFSDIFGTMRNSFRIGGLAGVRLVHQGGNLQIRDGGDTAYQNLHCSSLNLETALPVLEGGTGATTAADARTNLGALAIGDAISTSAGTADAGKATKTNSNGLLDGTLGGVPPGTVIWFAANSPPAGYIKANGAAVSRTTYATLFAAIGTTWGAGDGSTTFNVPDGRGEFLRGWDDGRGVDSGRAFASAQAANLSAHQHNLQAHTGATAAQTTGDGVISTTTGILGRRTRDTSPFITINNAVDLVGTGTDNRPRNIALLACIKY